MKTISKISEIGEINRGTKYNYFISDYNDALKIADFIKDKLQSEAPDNRIYLVPFSPTKQIRVFSVADYLSQEYRVHICFDKNYENAQEKYERELEEESKNTILEMFI